MEPSTSQILSKPLLNHPTSFPGLFPFFKFPASANLKNGKSPGNEVVNHQNYPIIPFIFFVVSLYWNHSHAFIEV